MSVRKNGAATILAHVSGECPQRRCFGPFGRRFVQVDDFRRAYTAAFGAPLGDTLFVSRRLEIEWGSAVLRGKTRDISANGMFIESADTLWVGAGFTARLALDRPVQMDCSVKRIEPGRGMAVSVTVSEEQHQRRYQDLIASLTRPET